MLPARIRSRSTLLPRTCASWARREKGGDHQREHGSGERDADPQAPRHISQLRSRLFGGGLTRFERHAALRTTAQPHLPDLRMHRTGVFPLRCGLSRRMRRSCVRLDRRVLLWCSTKLRGAHLAAEVDSRSPMFNARRRVRGIDLHPAHRIAFFSPLHGAIMAVFAHFAPFHSHQGSASMKMAARPEFLGFRFVQLADALMLCWRLLVW